MTESLVKSVNKVPVVSQFDCTVKQPSKFSKTIALCTICESLVISNRCLCVSSALDTWMIACIIKHMSQVLNNTTCTMYIPVVK